MNLFNNENELSLKPIELCEFTESLAILIKAELPLDSVLYTLARSEETSQKRRLADKLLELVRSGHSLAEAMKVFPKTFDPAYRGLIYAGEMSGYLGNITEKLAEDLRRIYEIKRKIVSSLLYPLVLLGVSVFAILFIVFYVLPIFMSVFDNMNSPLPPSARIILGISQFVIDNIYLLITLLIAMIIGFVLLWRQPKYRVSFEGKIINIFFFGRLIRNWQISNYLRTLVFLIEGSVPLPESCQYALQAVSNLYMKERLFYVSQDLQEGLSLSAALDKSKVFPPGPLHMIAIGEQSGNMIRMFNYISKHLESKINTDISRIVSLIEPTIIIFMGLIVGFIVVTMINTILSLTYGSL